ncbi:hypothetical protein BJ742DRAFT_249147 [Cladochytrium replicatum]|nr:hypothetical protein BJ742DRAFT_249147 [Cladochytrium replicatum]
MLCLPHLEPTLIPLWLCVCVVQPKYTLTDDVSVMVGSLNIEAVKIAGATAKMVDVLVRQAYFHRVTKAATHRGRRKRTSRSGATSSPTAVSPAERRRSASDTVAKIRRQTINGDSGHSGEEENVADKTLVNFSWRKNKTFDDGDDPKNRGRK